MLLSHAFFQAVAPGAGGGAASSLLVNLLPMVGIIAIFYFLLIRPQNQRAKKHKEMLGALKKGDAVVTSGGILGKVLKIADSEVTIDTGEGGKLRILRGMILEVQTKSELAPANDVRES